MKVFNRIVISGLVALLLTIGLCYAQSVKEQHSRQGVDYAAQGKFKEAKEEFEKSLKIDPFFGPAKRALKVIEDVNEQKLERQAVTIYFKGVAYAIKGQHDQAISDYNKAIEINPRFANCYFSRGVAYAHGRGQYDQAISDFNKSIELNPMFAKAYFSRGLAYAEGSGRYDRAISDYSKAIEINPRSENAYFSRGVAYAQGSKQYDQAISDYNKAIELNPMFADAYFNRAVAYYFKGEYGKAWEDVHKLRSMGLQINPGFLKALREASGREK